MFNTIPTAVEQTREGLSQETEAIELSIEELTRIAGGQSTVALID